MSAIDIRSHLADLLVPRERIERLMPVGVAGCIPRADEAGTVGWVPGDAIRAYHDLLDDYMTKRSDRGVIHVDGHYRPYM